MKIILIIYWAYPWQTSNLHIIFKCFLSSFMAALCMSNNLLGEIGGSSCFFSLILWSPFWAWSPSESPKTPLCITRLYASWYTCLPLVRSFVIFFRIDQRHYITLCLNSWYNMWSCFIVQVAPTMRPDQCFITATRTNKFGTRIIEYFIESYSLSYHCSKADLNPHMRNKAWVQMKTTTH